MALIKCRECGNPVSTEAAACPHCGAPQRPVAQQERPPQKQGVGFCGCLTVAMIAVVIFWVIYRYVQDSGTPPTTSSEQSSSTPAPAPPSDDADVLIAKYGSPDREETTARDFPRPPIPTRFLIYDAERVRAVYVPDGKEGEPPPYKWKLMGFQDSQDNSVLTPAEAVDRLKNRKKQ